jgi:hypothetical protein
VPCWPGLLKRARTCHAASLLSVGLTLAVLIQLHSFSAAIVGVLPLTNVHTAATLSGGGSALGMRKRDQAHLRALQPGPGRPIPDRRYKERLAAVASFFVATGLALQPIARRPPILGSVRSSFWRWLPRSQSAARTATPRRSGSNTWLCCSGYARPMDGAVACATRP